MSDADAFDQWLPVLLKKPWKAAKLDAMLPDQPELVLRLREALEEAHADQRRPSVTGRPRRAGPGGAVAPPRDTVISCRVDASELEAIDLLVAASIRPTRSDAAGWFIRQGMRANAAWLAEVRGTVDEIRRLQDRAQRRAREQAGELPDAAPGASEETDDQ